MKSDVAGGGRRRFPGGNDLLQVVGRLCCRHGTTGVSCSGDPCEGAVDWSVPRGTVTAGEAPWQLPAWFRRGELILARAYCHASGQCDTIVRADLHCRGFRQSGLVGTADRAFHRNGFDPSTRRSRCSAGRAVLPVGEREAAGRLARAVWHAARLWGGSESGPMSWLAWRRTWGDSTPCEPRA